MLGILSVFILLASGSSFAQVIDFPLQDDKSAKLLLRNIVILDSQQYYDPKAERKEYYLGIEFGREKFEVAIYNAKTGEHITTSFTLIGQSYFTKAKATEDEEEYKMSKNGIDYSISFTEIKPSSKPDKREIMLWVEVRDTVRNKILYRAFDAMYLPH